MRNELGEVTASLQEDLTGVRVIQAFGREEQSRDAFREVNARYRAANQRTVGANALYFPGVEYLSTIATAIVFGYGGWLYMHGQVEIGTLVAFVGYLTNFFDPVQQLSQVYNTFLAASAALEKIFGVLDAEPDIVDREGAIDLPPIAGDVRFEGVRFGYDPARPVLHGLDLVAEAGQTVALVGHTGAGKSTIVKLLARFYDPQAGTVSIDGHDLRDVTHRPRCGASSRSCRRRASCSPARCATTSPSAAPRRASTRCARRPRAVGADGFIEALPDGYDTLVQERGGRLSIGQRQLVAFARALLAEPRLLILDEATSSVDIATEARIEEALETLLAGRTAFVVAHRLSTIRRADRIVVLENGVVVEAGTHDELIARGGRYRSLYGDWVEAVA